MNACSRFISVPTSSKVVVLMVHEPQSIMGTVGADKWMFPKVFNRRSFTETPFLGIVQEHVPPSWHLRSGASSPFSHFRGRCTQSTRLVEREAAEFTSLWPQHIINISDTHLHTPVITTLATLRFFGKDEDKQAISEVVVDTSSFCRWILL
eukprot:TRINITY_DN8373_c0_g1_i4.p1 TRINITY_DN8373_c0_g1~~TRINITY_DN8373_c0_g1_i4.p1  ORF type:complete len:151 (-),score=18.03 TRINITY_DN8373_c0_g1_i4:16-468(-)